MYNLLLVEDDTDQLDALALLLKEYNSKFTILKAADYDTAVSYLNAYTIDIFILDIDLSRTSNQNSGIHLGEYIRNNPNYLCSPIIFITSVPEKISEAINELHCYSYILKPYHRNDITKAIDTIINSSMIHEATLIISNMNGIGFKLKESEILYIEANGRYINIHTFHGDIQTSDYTLDELSSSGMLCSFIRCHRKYLVNTTHITNYDKTNQLLACGSYTISVGRAYKNDFEKRYYDN